MTPGRMPTVTRVRRRSDPAERRAERRSSARRAPSAALASSAAGSSCCPTDTVYGVGADAFDPDAVQRLLDAKGRGREMPPPVLVSARDDARRARRERARLGAGAGRGAVARPADPGLPPAAALQWDLGETRGTVAVRMPDHEVALELLVADRPAGGQQREPGPAARRPPTPTRPRRCSATRSR